MKRPGPMLALFLTVLIDLLGFAMFIPDIQLRGESVARMLYGADATKGEIGWFVGIMLAAYSVAQLFTSPQLGRWSDIKGRRPVLLLSSALAVVGYLIYGHWVTPEGMILSRILTGIAAANLGVAFAYVADTTAPEDRAKSLGMLGAAFGIGFIFGPVLGSQLLKVSNDSPALLSNVSATLAAVNMVFIYFWLPESVKPGNQPRAVKPIADLITALKTPGLGILIVMFFTVNLCFTNLETTYFRLLAEPSWIFKFRDPKDSGALVLAMVGVVGVIVQGVLVRLAVKKYGELTTLRYAYLIFVPSFVLIPFTPLWFPGVLVIVGLGLGNGLANPSLNALISQRAPSSMQGGIFGITQSLGALARALGPLMSNPLFSYKPYAPYVVGGILAMVPLVAAWTLVKQEPHHAA